jgi:hypothetical protein
MKACFTPQNGSAIFDGMILLVVTTFRSCEWQECRRLPPWFPRLELPRSDLIQRLFLGENQSLAPQFAGQQTEHISIGVGGTIPKMASSDACKAPNTNKH